ncbi:MAG: RagB/SusD family nutrient uptake outer membrane protein [Duncaniella sp.]|nr:RagB/SusD family nutrient uptake outer membrane protein [Duncaniella sp.]
MNKIYIKSIIFGLLGLSLNSCNDFLEPQSSSEFVPKDANSLNEILLGEAYPHTSSSYYLEGFVHLFDDDVAMAEYQDPQSGFNIEQYFIPFTWQPDLWNELDQVVTAKSYNQYYYCYEFILGCNAILDYIGQAEGDLQDDIDNVVAQAHTLRAFYYLQLVNLFGAPYTYAPDSPGVPLKLTSKIENKPLTRNTVREVYEQIVEDLTEAITLYESLPENRKWKMDYRTSLPMAELLLSRVYLYMENWEEAAKYAERVMKNSNFTLTDLNTIQRYTTTTPVQRTYHDFHSYTGSTECIWPYGRRGDFFLWLTDYVVEQGTGLVKHSYFKASPDLMDSFEEYDLRKDCYVVRSWYVDSSGEEFPQAVGKTTVSAQFTCSNDNLSIFGRSLRYAEAFVNYAEAKSNIPGGEIDAIAALNELREMRFESGHYQPLGNMSAEACRQFVREERRRELCFEGQRWFDLRRWGMPEIKHVWYPDAETAVEYVLSAQDLQYTLPLPNSTVDSNPELTQNPQASGPRQGTTISR